MVRVIEDMFGIAVNPMTQKTDQVRRFTLSTDRGMCVSIITLGAIIQRINVPDVDGKLEDVCLGYDDVAGYYRNQPAYFGATIGRVANRVARGRFKLCGKEVSVSRNFRGQVSAPRAALWAFDSVIWGCGGNTQRWRYLPSTSRRTATKGTPERLPVNINFSLNDTGCFGMRIEARAKATTCVNITNHAYFNLAGHGSGRDTLLQHMLMIKAQKIVDTDLEQIPTGKLMRIRNTPYDFSSLVNLGKRIGQLANCPIHGFDNNYCVDVPPNRVQLVARVVHPCSGRFMEVHTNQPGVQFYTANNLPDEDRGGAPNIGKAGAHYVRHGSFCLETQKYPDAMNHDDFPSIVLNPGQLYDHQVVYRFGACPKRI
ncbi:GL24851 [Drosophila persimilis]|uniref:Aldose 1-epimerase n=1 Tax=Drosophila persimilis TaxID=7234 RepID=B4GRX6_DROPE|nr:GL24851 [Drosophila persimilis]